MARRLETTPSNPNWLQWSASPFGNVSTRLRKGVCDWRYNWDRSAFAQLAIDFANPYHPGGANRTPGTRAIFPLATACASGSLGRQKFAPTSGSIRHSSPSGIAEFVANSPKTLLVVDVGIAVSLAVALSCRRVVCFSFVARVVAAGAGFSYSLYLIHRPVAVFNGAALERMGWPTALGQPGFATYSAFA